MGFASPLKDLVRATACDAFGGPAVLTSGGETYDIEGIYRREAVTVADESGMPVESIREVFDVRDSELAQMPSRPTSRDTIAIALTGKTHTVVNTERPHAGHTLLILGRATS